MLFGDQDFERFDIPWEPEQWIAVRKLPHIEMQACRDKAMDANLRRMQQMGGDIVKAIMSSQSRADTDREPTMDEYDHGELIKRGLVDWSYPEEIKPAAVSRLDTRTYRFIAAKVWHVSRPPTEAERLGNSSASSAS